MSWDQEYWFELDQYGAGLVKMNAFIKDHISYMAASFLLRQENKMRINNIVRERDGAVTRKGSPAHSVK